MQNWRSETSEDWCWEWLKEVGLVEDAQEDDVTILQTGMDVQSQRRTTGKRQTRDESLALMVHMGP